MTFFRPWLGTLLLACTGLGLVGCGDDPAGDDDGSGTAGSTSDEPTTGDAPTGDAPTGDAPTGGETTGSETSGGTDDTGTSGDTDAPASCHALPLPDELIAAGAWDPELGIAGFAGVDGLNPGVFDLARDAEGTLLAAGYFEYVGGEVVHAIARRDGDSWGPEPQLSAAITRPIISAIAADELGSVAIATYSALPGPLEQREGEILLREGGEVTTIATFKGAVRRLAWFEGELWVAGVFELDGEPVGAGLAVYDGAKWKDAPGGAPVGAGVYELAVEDGELLVGGAFSQVGGIAAQSVASWDGAAWTGFDLPEATVLALARDGEGQLHAGGLFSVEGSFVTGGVARWSEDAWTSLAGGLANTSFRGVVSDLELHQGALYVAGCFSSAGGVPEDPAAVPARDLARWTGSAWEPLADPEAGIGTAWFSPLKCGDEGPGAVWEMQYQRLLADEDRLYLGGFFPGVDHTASQSIVALAGDVWIAQGEAGRGFSGGVRSLAVGGPECAVHVMGGVTHTGALAVDARVLRDDGDAWTPVGPPVPPELYCWGHAVDAAGVPVLGCEGQPAGDEPPPGVIVRLVDDAWQPVISDIPSGGVASVGFDPAGELWGVGGASEGYVVRSSGELVNVEFPFNGRASALAFRPGAADEPVQVVVGGYFTELNGVPAGGVAHWDGAAWQTLGAGLVGSVLAVAYAEDGEIYASTADDGTPDRMVLAMWNGSSWAEVATPEPGPVEAGYAFYSLVARGPYVVAAGFAWPDSNQRNVFVYDGEQFTSLRGGVTAISVDTAVLAKDGLWFGGSIAEAGAPDARISSVGVAHLE